MADRLPLKPPPFPVLTPKGTDSRALAEHADKLVDALDMTLSDEQVGLLVSEIRNALAPASFVGRIDPQNATAEDIRDVDVSVRRLLAFADAVVRRRQAGR